MADPSLASIVGALGGAVVGAHVAVVKLVLVIAAVVSAAVVAAARSQGAWLGWVVSFSAAGTLGVAIVSLYLTRKVHEVHVLVNSRFTRVLEILGVAEGKIAESRATGRPVPPADDSHDVTAL